MDCSDTQIRKPAPKRLYDGPTVCDEPQNSETLANRKFFRLISEVVLLFKENKK